MMMRRLTTAVSAFAILLTTLSAADASKEARVTQIIREVNLLPGDGPARRAMLNESVRETTAVKTGGESRAERTFVDLTIIRIGANTLYRFKKSGREVEMESGSVLLRVPKNSGGATVITSAITAGSTGTTFIFESIRDGAARLTVLEGSARLTLMKHPDQTRSATAGQALEVPPGATRIPEPKTVDLDRLMKTSPLIVGFRPLPSKDLINNAARQQQQRGPLNQPNRNGPSGPQNTAPPPPPGPR
jgi:ferric-dicitrate binding protein FerR (iron transport regulator)